MRNISNLRRFENLNSPYNIFGTQGSKLLVNSKKTVVNANQLERKEHHPIKLNPLYTWYVDLIKNSDHKIITITKGNLNGNKRTRNCRVGCG